MAAHCDIIAKTWYAGTATKEQGDWYSFENGAIRVQVYSYQELTPEEYKVFQKFNI